MSIFNKPKNESTDSEAIAPVTLKTINNNAKGATFGNTCENKIFIRDPPVIRAESTKGFTLTCKACDLMVITEPPNPPIVPRTTAKCQTCNSAKAEIINTGLQLGIDYGMTSTCYDPYIGGEPCGKCDACFLRLKGFDQAGAIDPLNYPIN